MCFDCLHDMGDPTGAAATCHDHRQRRHVADRGAAGQRPAGGQPQPGRSGVLLRLDAICAPTRWPRRSVSGLGAQAGEARLRHVVEAGGFTRFRRAAETPFNLVSKPDPEYLSAITSITRWTVARHCTSGHGRRTSARPRSPVRCSAGRM